MPSEGNCQNILTSHIISTKDDNSDGNGKESKEPDYDGDKDRLEVGRRETEEINKQPIKFFEKLLYYWKKYFYILERKLLL
jgi:hypothetical protein